MAMPLERDREGERGWEENAGMSKCNKITLLRGIFANVWHRGATWYATSASDAGVTCLGPRMNHLTRFKDPYGRFEILEI